MLLFMYYIIYYVICLLYFNGYIGPQFNAGSKRPRIILRYHFAIAIRVQKDKNSLPTENFQPENRYNTVTAHKTSVGSSTLDTIPMQS